MDRGLANAAYVRRLIAERGWTDEIEREALPIALAIAEEDGPACWPCHPLIAVTAVCVGFWVIVGLLLAGFL